MWGSVAREVRVSQPGTNYPFQGVPISYIQGDTSGFVKSAVDNKTKVAFWYTKPLFSSQQEVGSKVMCHPVSQLT